MTRVALFFTPALFVVCAGAAYVTQERDREELSVILMFAALLFLGLWFIAVHLFEVSAWRAGRGGRSL